MPSTGRSANRRCGNSAAAPACSSLPPPRWRCCSRCSGYIETAPARPRHAQVAHAHCRPRRDAIISVATVGVLRRRSAPDRSGDFHMLGLYYAPGACSMAAHIVLEESGEKYEPLRVDLAKGEQRAEAYLKLNPLGRVPVLRLDDGK